MVLGGSLELLQAGQRRLHEPRLFLVVFEQGESMIGVLQRFAQGGTKRQHGFDRSGWRFGRSIVNRSRLWWRWLGFHVLGRVHGSHCR